MDLEQNDTAPAVKQATFSMTAEPRGYAIWQLHPTPTMVQWIPGIDGYTATARFNDVVTNHAKKLRIGM